MKSYVFNCYSNILNDMKGMVYKDFCSQREEKLDSCILFDLKVCIYNTNKC
jgi:hypothetical protein